MDHKIGKNIYDVVIVGAGPAGLIAAGRAAELGAKVLLIEKMKRPGRKLLLTGKGRCNISNDGNHSDYFKNIFPNGRFLKQTFGRFFSGDIVKLLNDQGVATSTERGNRIFPASDNAEDVLNGLLKWLRKFNIDTQYQTSVAELLTDGKEINILRANQQGRIQEIFTKNVIICTGGKSYPATGSTGDGFLLAKQAGHTISDVRPALVPLVTSGVMAKALQGLSLKNVKAAVWINGKKQREEFGEMLFAHFGLTGPIILTLSRFVVDELNKKNKVEINIDLKPALDEQKLDARLLRDLNTYGKKKLENIFKLWLPSKMIPLFLQQLHLDGQKPGHQVLAKERRTILVLMKNLKLEVVGHRGFKEAIITAGGVNTDEIDRKTMRSKLVHNLYFAGEVIDLDANTGGYNLQIAYSTAWLAAESCMKPEEV